MPPPPSPKLTLSPAHRTDLQTLAQTQLEAFVSSPFNQTLFPQGATPDTVARMTERYQRAFDGDEFSRFVVVREGCSSSVDTGDTVNGDKVNENDDGDEDKNKNSPGKILGFARWHCFERVRNESEWKEKEEKREWPNEVNLDAVKEFFDMFGVKRRGIMEGRKFYMLGVLAVDPAYQRRGVGAQLLGWGLERADRLGIPAYLEASEVGFGLYKKHGFEEVDEIVTDMGKWGTEGIYRHVCMIRQPVRKEVDLS